MKKMKVEDVNQLVDTAGDGSEDPKVR
jgi:sorting nexin-1/2